MDPSLGIIFEWQQHWAGEIPPWSILVQSATEFMRIEGNHVWEVSPRRKREWRFVLVTSLSWDFHFLTL